MATIKKTDFGFNYEKRKTKNVSTKKGRILYFVWSASLQLQLVDDERVKLNGHRGELQPGTTTAGL